MINVFQSLAGDQLETLPLIKVEHTASLFRIVRVSDDKPLIECNWTDEKMAEDIADALAAHRFVSAARLVRDLMHHPEKRGRK